MSWLDKLVLKVDKGKPQIINDSKTPSGRVHVGALRGVLIHDAVCRVLKERGIAVRYLFGVDDYDPLDELPAGQGQHFEKYLGQPLCNVPPPPGSNASDMAEHYIREFFDVFQELGVGAETYRMRDIYRSGEFNEAIDIILKNAATVRQVYKEVNNAERPDNWYPFQVICEYCGRIGTTEVIGYENQEVLYRCRAHLVSWARGCGYQGKVSPFNGNGKLPWKLEWVAKWHNFPVTIEGAGKDHTTKGGSRDVASQCLRRIFGQEPPLNIPYEFFLVGGAKMSSSRGVGASARDMANFLPPDVLRFLVLRTPPNRPVNFSLNEEYMIKLFNDFDRYRWRTYHDPNVTQDEKQVYLLSQVCPEGDYYSPNFQLILTLIQMPHIDLYAEIEKRKGMPLTEIEVQHLRQRVQAAQYWLENYAEDDEKLQIQKNLPERAYELTATQRAFLHRVANLLPFSPKDEEALQSRIFAVARLTPINTAQGFQAIYRVLFDRDSGPKAGNLLTVLDKEFVFKRFQEMPYSKVEFWQETGLNIEAFEEWFRVNIEQIRSASVRLQLFAVELELPLSEANHRLMVGLGVIEFTITLLDSKTHMKRLLFNEFKGIDLSFAKQNEYFSTYGREYIKELTEGLKIPMEIEGVYSHYENLMGILNTEGKGYLVS